MQMSSSAGCKQGIIKRYKKWEGRSECMMGPYENTAFLVLFSYSWQKWNKGRRPQGKDWMHPVRGLYQAPGARQKEW